jgi:F-type H+-transporting ATPase subunit b
LVGGEFFNFTHYYIISMELLNPSVGLVVYMTLSFLLLLFLLKKFAWKPMLSALNEREESIRKSLEAAKEAESKMTEMNSRAEALLLEAKKERDQILKEARENALRFEQEVKEKTAAKAEEMIAQAKQAIINEKMQAMTELRNQVGLLAVEIAEKVLKEKLEAEGKQSEILERSLNELTWN